MFPWVLTNRFQLPSTGSVWLFFGIHWAATFSSLFCFQFRVCAKKNNPKKWCFPSAASREFSLATSSEAGASWRSSGISFVEVFLC